MEGAGADYAARQGLQLGGHALLKHGALARRQGSPASTAAIFVDGIERDYENVKAVVRPMAERDAEVRLH